MSESPRPSTDQPATAGTEDPDLLTDDDADADPQTGPEVQLTRRERRARAGGPAAKVHGPQAGKNHPLPAKGRDYAHRRRG